MTAVICLAALQVPAILCAITVARNGRRQFVKGFMKVRDVIVLLQQDGWELVATRGSHRQYKHLQKPGRVTVPGRPSADLAPGTLNSILKQADLR